MRIFGTRLMATCITDSGSVITSASDELFISVLQNAAAKICEDCMLVSGLKCGESMLTWVPIACSLSGMTSV
jgi:hypothetical protein